MFLRGIENSISTFAGGRERVDGMDECGDYRRRKTDLSLVRELRLRFLRYGLLLHRTWLGGGR